MDLLTTVITKIEAQARAHAHAALAQPGDGDGFAYGRACGFYAGLNAAIETINEVIEERDDEDRRM